MRFLDLATAASEIQQACQENRECGKGSPFFFLAGAGISSPPIPLAYELEEQCRQTALRYHRTQEPPKSDSIVRYSHWFRQAYPQREQRQRFLRKVMETAFISRANFRLAHLMLNSTVSNLVATTNFDDSLSRALRLFGHSHVVCDHPRTTARIDLLSSDTQIVHVHGSYWYYDCCNLTEEIEDRARSSNETSLTMAALLDGVMRDHSPIVVGYSGWEGDIFTNALRRKLPAGFKNNIYWFCFRQEDAANLPSWLTPLDELCVVCPPPPKPDPSPSPDRAVESATGRPEDAKRLTRSGADAPAKPDSAAAQTTLPATAVFDELIRCFALEPPPLTRDPLGFFADQLDASLLAGNPDQAENDVYAIREVYAKVLRARQHFEGLGPVSAADAALQPIREAVRRSDWRTAVRAAANVDLSSLSGAQLSELMASMADAGSTLNDNSPDELASYDLVIAAAGRLLATQPSAEETSRALQRGSLALVNKGITLGNLNRTAEEMAVYDEAVRRYGNAREFAPREQAARALASKAYHLGLLDRNAEAVEVYDEMARLFENATEPSLRVRAAKALVSKGYRLGLLDRSEEETAVYDQVVLKYGDQNEPELREQVAMALVNKGVTLGSLDRSGDAIDVYDEVMRRFGDAVEPGLREQVAKALLGKGYRLAKVDRGAEAIEVYDEVVRRCGDATELAGRELAARALVNKGVALSGLNRSQEEIQVYDEVVRRLGDATEAALTEQLAKALVYKAITLASLERGAEAVAVYDDVLRRFGAATEPALRGLIAKALFNKAIVLGSLSRNPEAIEACDEIVHRFGEDADPVLREWVTRAATKKAELEKGSA
jgi:tetratricopeptide (TPR) repeat protein